MVLLLECLSQIAEELPILLESIVLKGARPTHHVHLKPGCWLWYLTRVLSLSIPIH